MHVHHAFLYISLSSLHDATTWKYPISRFPFPKISKKEDNLARYTQIFEKSFPKVFFPFIFFFAPGISMIFRWMVRISEIKQFSGISGNFSGKFLYQLPLLLNFREFWLTNDGKRPRSRIRKKMCLHGYAREGCSKM